jgi:hypothetical protein
MVELIPSVVDLMMKAWLVIGLLVIVMVMGRALELLVRFILERLPEIG